MSIPPRTLLVALVLPLSLWGPDPVPADFAVEVPALAASSNGIDDPGAFTVKVLWWDQKSEPNPIALKWGNGFINSFEYGHVGSGRRDQHTTIVAFRYALSRTPSVAHTGTVNIQGIAYSSTRMDGASAGAAMAVGFIALMNGDPIRRGVAMTGTLKPDGSIGPVGGIPGKVRAAAREGYHTVLIPYGQLSNPQWQLNRLAFELDITVKEARTIDEAYQLMTGRRL